MMRGYKPQHKSAKEILETLGFDPNIAVRGWVMDRTGGLTHSGIPVRMHALVHTDLKGNEYIDVHADLPGPNQTHITQRGRRTDRWNELFRQIDHGEPCDAGHKLLAHYAGLRHALEKYDV